MISGSHRAKVRFVVLGILCGAFLALGLLKGTPANAATGINQTINFQGRLLNSQGAVVPDGFYNIEFKIYQDGDGTHANDSTGSPSGSLKWTEDYLNQASHGVKVQNGYMTVNLGSVTPFGSNIDWNQSTLWLSMNIAGTGGSCTPFSSCSPDGEMLPMQPLTAAPYALNAGELGGVASSGFVQLAQGLQTDTSNVTAININKTGTGKLIDLQSSGTDLFTVDNTTTNTIGIGITGSTSANSTVHVADSSAGIQTVTIGSNSSSSGTTIQGGTGNIVIGTAAVSNTISIGATNQNITQTVNIGNNTNSSATENVNVGNQAGAGTTSIQGGTGGINIGTGGAANTINIGATNQAIAQTINIGNNTNSSGSAIITVGNAKNASSTTITSGTGGVNLNPNGGSNAGVTVKPTNNSTAALQVLNAAGSNAVLAADTTNGRVGVNNFSSLYSLDVAGNEAVGGNSQNLLVRSEAFDNGSWSCTNCSVTPNTTAAPNGSTVADSDVITNVSNNIHQTVTVSPSTTYTFSFYALAGTASAPGYSVFDVTNGSDIVSATTYTPTASWQRFSVTFTTASNTASVNVYPVRNTSSTGTVILWGGQLVTGTSAGAYVQTIASAVNTGANSLYLQGGISLNNIGSNTALQLQQDGKTVVNVGANGLATFTNSSNSVTAFQVQNAAGVNVAAVDTTGGQLVLGTAGVSGLTGQIKFNFTGQNGSITLAPLTPSSTNYTINLPAENGTVCTTAVGGACSTVYASATGTVFLAPSTVQADATSNNSIFINKTSGTGNILELQKSASDVFKVDNTGNVASTGQNTLSRNSSGASDYSFGVTGTPTASASSSLVRIGNALTTQGNSTANGGTYLSIVEPGSGTGSVADFLNFQSQSGTALQLTSTGDLSILGKYNTNTFTSSQLVFGNAGAATVSSNGSNNLTVDTGSSGGTETLGNNAATTNIGTNNAAHTIAIGTGTGGTTTQAVTVGSNTNGSSTLTLQGGNGGSAIILQTGNNGTTAGGIQIGNTSGAFNQTIAIGSNNAAANTVTIGTGTGQDSVTIGSNGNSTNSVTINAGTGASAITLGANTGVSAGSNLTFASGAGNFDAHNSTGTFDSTSGTNQLNGNTTVTGTKTFTVNGGTTTLNGATAGSGTAAKVNTNATSNVGLVVQGVSSQAAALLQLQDSTGSALQNFDALGDQDISSGYLNTAFGGLGAYGNLLVQSEQLGTTWTATNITVTQDDAPSNPAPNGTTTADKLASSASGTHTLTQTYSSAGNNTYTFSVWLKATSPPQPVQLRIDSNGTPSTGTAASYTLGGSWQRYTVTQAFSSGVTTVTPTLVITNNNAGVIGWGAQLIQAATAGAYARTTTAVASAGGGLVVNGSALFQNTSNSTTALQVQNASGVNVAAVDTTGGQLVLGTASTGGITGKIKLFNNTASSTGSITLQAADPVTTNYTITIPAENGQICTTAASAACTAVYLPNTATGYVQLAPSTVQADATSNNSIFINKTSGTGNILELQKSASDVFKVDNTGNVASTGQNTLSRNSSGASDYSFGVTGTPTASASSSLVRIGNALTTQGNSTANGGTYLSIVEPGSGTGSVADFLNFQSQSGTALQLTSTGDLSILGKYNTNTFTSSQLVFGNAGAATVSSNGSNNLTVDTGSSGGTETLGNNAATTNIGTNNAAHTIAIGTGTGGTTTQAVTVGSNTNGSSTLTLQGGNGGSAIILQTGNNGTTAGGIQIGNTSGAFNQTIAIGTNGTTNANNTVNIGTGSGTNVGDSVTIGNGGVATNSVSINGGSTGGITLSASTTNVNSSTVATNQSSIGIFNTNAITATVLQAATSISMGATTGTVTFRNANQTFGNAAGNGVFQNNGATYNSTLVVNNDSDGGSLGGTPSSPLTAAQSVDVYSSISINQTTGGQTITFPTPTASTNYGRVIYITNIGTASFIVNNVAINPGQGGTMIWSNTNGGASWQFAGAGADSINNQTANDQTANFRISGTGRANTGFTAPSFDSITGTLNVGNVNATTINIGNSGSTPTTDINLLTKGNGTTVKTATDVTNAFQVQNNAGANILQVDSQNRNVKIYENNGTTSYALIYFDTTTATANYTASAGTVAVGRGAGAISVAAGSGSGITITSNAASTWKTTSGTLTLQSGTGSSDYLILNSGGSNQVQVNGSAVVKLGSASADPTCTTGAIYYNTTSNLFRGCQNGTWATLSSTTQTLQQAYTASTGGSTPEIKLGTTRTSLDVQDADSTLGGVLFAVRGSNAGGLGTSLFNVSSGNNTVNIGTSANSTALLVLGIDTNSTFNAGTTTSGATEIDGAMFYSSSDNNFLCGVAGQWQTCNGLLYSNTSASSAVNTCTNACAAFNTNNSAMIPAGYCQAGRVISLSARGHYSVTGTPTLQMGVYYGTNTTTRGSDTQIGALTPAPASASGATNQYWALDYKITCFDTSHMMGEGTYTFQNNTTSTLSMLVLNVLSTSSTSVTTTAANSLYLFPTWSASSASNTVTLDQLAVTGN